MFFFCINQRDGGAECCAELGAANAHAHAKARLQAANAHGPGKVRANRAGCEAVARELRERGAEVAILLGDLQDPATPAPFDPRLVSASMNRSLKLPLNRV